MRSSCAVSSLHLPLVAASVLDTAADAETAGATSHDGDDPAEAAALGFIAAAAAAAATSKP